MFQYSSCISEVILYISELCVCVKYKNYIIYWDVSFPFNNLPSRSYVAVTMWNRPHGALYSHKHTQHYGQHEIRYFHPGTLLAYVLL